MASSFVRLERPRRTARCGLRDPSISARLGEACLLRKVPSLLPSAHGDPVCVIHGVPSRVVCAYALSRHARRTRPPYFSQEHDPAGLCPCCHSAYSYLMSDSGSCLGYEQAREGLAPRLCSRLASACALSPPRSLLRGVSQTARTRITHHTPGSGMAAGQWKENGCASSAGMWRGRVVLGGRVASYGRTRFFYFLRSAVSASCQSTTSRSKRRACAASSLWSRLIDADRSQLLSILDD